MAAKVVDRRETWARQIVNNPEFVEGKSTQLTIKTYLSLPLDRIHGQ